MNKTERTIKVLHSLAKNTVLTRQEYQNLSSKQYRLVGEGLLNFDAVISQQERFGVEKVVEHYTTTTSKVSVTDVIEMMKQGYTVEQIEAKVYTQVKVVKIKII